MVRPAKFAFNPQTAATNSFQSPSIGDVHAQALNEFDTVAAQLRAAGFRIEIAQDDITAPLPDSVFPNNWFSTHPHGKMLLYPMLTENRRAERKPEIVHALRRSFGYTSFRDLSPNEHDERFLEGTGSVVFDHAHHIAYASVSARTHSDVLLEVCGELGYLPFLFVAYDRNNRPVYHTNVVMAIGDGIAVCCFEAVHDEHDRAGLHTLLRRSDKEVVPISLAQMESFAGNMLFITNAAGKKYVAVSSTAWDSLSEAQKTIISSHAEPVIAKIPTIEKHGGGSIRCMLAELY
jgi:hypothetical protein